MKSWKKYRIIKALVILVALVFSNASYAIGNLVQTNDSDKPVNIKADSLAVMNSDKYAVFKGNVIVTQGTMTIKADEMRVYSFFDEKLKKNQFKRIECFGNVDFTSQAKKAKSDEAIYYVTDGVMELTKNVFLQDGGNTIQGQKFVYEIKSGRSSISNNPLSSVKKAEDNLAQKMKNAKDALKSNLGNTGRVKAILVPGKTIEKIEMPSAPEALQKKFEKKE